MQKSCSVNYSFYFQPQSLLTPTRHAIFRHKCTTHVFMLSFWEVLEFLKHFPGKSLIFLPKGVYEPCQCYMTINTIEQYFYFIFFHQCSHCWRRNWFVFWSTSEACQFRKEQKMSSVLHVSFLKHSCHAVECFWSSLSATDEVSWKRKEFNCFKTFPVQSNLAFRIYNNKNH